MAKPKVDILVKVLTESSIDVWTSSIDIDEILPIEGVTTIYKFKFSSNQAFVRCDPRYDVNEIADEIRTLLTSKIPDVFKDAYTE